MAFRELTPEEWLVELDHGLQYRKKFGLEQMWGTLEAIYYNVHESRMNDGPNILMSQGDSMLSTVSVPAPYVTVEPEWPESVQTAPLLEALDNNLLRVLELQEEVETANLNAFLFGVGVVKTGYDSEWGYDPELDLGGAMKLGLSLTQLNRTGKRRIEHDAKIAPGMPWHRSVMPHDIVVPWGVRDLRTTPWIAHRLVRHIDDLKADSKYENTQRLNGQISLEDFVNSYRTTAKLHRTANTRMPEFIELYEIMDRRTGKVYVITPDHDRFLRREQNALQIENQLPYASISFTPKTRSFWTTPDAFYLFHVQKELSDVAVQRTKQRRLAVLKFLVQKGAMDVPELQKILSTDVGAAAMVNDGAVRSIQEAIMPFQAPVNMQLAQEEDLLRANAREQIGFSRNQVGEYTGGRKTATEVGEVARSSQLRMSRRGLRVKRLYEQCIENQNRLIFEHWTMGHYVKVIGPSQANQFVQVNGPMLRGRYSYKVDFSTEQENESLKMQALQLYSFMRQDPDVDPMALREFLVSQFNDQSFRRIFDAGVRGPVPEMQQGGGGGRTNGQPPRIGSSGGGGQRILPGV